MSELLDYKCPSCGGSIEFNSSTQNMKCPYCGSEFNVNTLKDMDKGISDEVSQEDLEWKKNFNEWSGEETQDMSVYRCESCGGEIIADDTTSATMCPYCGANVVIKGQFSGDLRPSFLIPFKIDKKTAIEGLQRHLKGKYFLPKAFKDENHIDEIKGVYVPFWIFNCDASGDVKYKASNIRYWSDSDYEYTETTTYLVTRNGNVAFEKIPVDGSSKMDDDLMESIEPYYACDIMDFQTAFLAGYIAQRYDVTSEQSIRRANERVKESVEDAFRSTVTGYDNVEVSSSVVSTYNSTVDYALYPVWLLHTSWNGDNYTFAMNGQTGRFVGDLPIDRAAYMKWFFTFGIAISAIVSIIITLV
ncbi:DNA-directed RNA polymerase, subunit RPC12/RpoP, contains C4-type Zn-finger [[Eubacterium] yurii]|nr:DNA-directed RNA polymerase, subunit RPC12/RpoP, contains C4-type Zn-finger [[Eubacterium] yurii]